MEPAIVGIGGIVILFAMLLGGFHIAVALGLVGFFGFLILSGWQPALTLAAGTAFRVCSTYSFSVVPLFMLMGMVVFTSGLATHIYAAMYRWFGRLPGGLMVATTLAAAVFAACSGSSVAAAVTFAKIAVPEMLRMKYHGGLACGAVAASGTQSALIPPSTLLIIYGIITETSIGKCLIAGFLPGILSNFLYVLTVLAVAIWKPHLLPRGRSFTMKEKLISLKMVWTIPLIAIIVLGGIYTGFFSPTEAGGIGAFAAIVVALVTVGPRKFGIREALSGTLNSTAMLFLILIGAFILSGFLVTSRLPTGLAEFITTAGVSRFVVLIGIICMWVFMGTFMASVAMVVITMPIVFPIIVSLGYDPIWFAIITVKCCEIGVITPPVGLNVYAVKGAVGDLVELGSIFKGIIPFLIMDFITLAILIAFPSISLFLPQRM